MELERSALSFVLLAVFVSLASCRVSAGEHLVVVVFNGLSSRDLRTDGDSPVKKAIENGVSAEVRSVFPTETYPNLYSIVTGLSPSIHGVLWNRMVDEDTRQVLDASSAKDDLLLQGDLIWKTAAAEHVQTGDFTSGKRRPGGLLAAPCAKCAPHQVIDNMLKWVKSSIERNASASTLSFVTFPSDARFEDVAGYCLERLQSQHLDSVVNVLFAGDHGLSEVEHREPICLSQLLNSHDYDVIDYSGGAVSVRPAPNETVMDLLTKIQAIKGVKPVPYLDFDKTFHTTNGHRAAPITIVADHDHVLVNEPCDSADIHSAISRSGYNTDAGKSTVLLATGPGFASGTEGKPVSVMEIHTVMCSVLRLKHGACRKSPSRAVQSLLAPVSEQAKQVTTEQATEKVTEQVVVVHGEKDAPEPSHRVIGGAGIFFIVLAGLGFLGGIYGLKNFFAQRRRSAGYRLVKDTMEPDLSMRTQPLLNGEDNYLGGSLQLSVMSEKSASHMVSEDDDDDGPPDHFDV